MNLIGLVGFIGSGKGSVGDMLESKFGYQKESFAKSVKDAIGVIFSWDRKMLEGDTPESRAWREQPDEYWSKVLKKEFSPRYALQLMGTEAGRNVFHQDLWMFSLQRRLKKNNNYVITDVRFPNEIEMIAKMGGRVVRVRRGPDPDWFAQAVDANNNKDSVGSMTTRETMQIHYSEWAWCGSPYISHTITNDGTLEDLSSQINLLTLLV